MTDHGVDTTRNPWPSVFSDLATQLESASEMVIIAESWAQQLARGHCTRTLTCGLVSLSDYEKVTPEDELGHDVSSSGPYPVPRPDYEYVPRFWIHGGAAIRSDIEPLVLSWGSSNQTVHWPDPGLLMTYGLVPRVTGQARIHWDNPSLPQYDVVLVEPVSKFDFPDESPGSVKIRRDYLQDYASLRGRFVVCVFYERWLLPKDEEIERVLGPAKYKEVRYPGAYIRFQRIIGSKHEFHVDMWGHFLLIRPGPLTVSNEYDNYGELKWPGIDTPVTHSKALSSRLFDYVYVSDSVLGHYEGRDEYSVHPESGGVSYGGQWAVGFCDRYGRDIIRLELKKLYEGTPPHVVRHWHSHAVGPPDGHPQVMLKARNVGVRAMELTYAATGLGEAIAALAKRALGEPVSGASVNKLDRDKLRYHGSWTDPNVRPIGYHIPLSMTEEGFLNRCKDLYALLVEGLSLRLLRRLLRALGMDKDLVHDWGSLKCLSQLVKLALVASEETLDITEDSKFLLHEASKLKDLGQVSNLFALADLRQLDAHRGGESKQEILRKGLQAIGVDPPTTVAGFGLACDALYDQLIQALSEMTRILRAI